MLLAVKDWLHEQAGVFHFSIFKIYRVSFMVCSIGRLQ